MTYQDSWAFWLDDACYCVARGVRYLALPSEVDADFWREHMQIEAAKMALHHGVLVRAVGDDAGVEIQVAKHQWVFEMLDRARQYGGEEEHMVIGVLLGYSSDAIEQYLHDVCRPDPAICAMRQENKELKNLIRELLENPANVRGVEWIDRALDWAAKAKALVGENTGEH